MKTSGCSMIDNKILFKVNKLIRDKLPSHMLSKRINPKTYILNDEQLKKYLNEKLIEEAKEVISASEATALTEELADLLEVMKTIAKIHEIKWDSIQNMALNKLDHYGGFNEGVFCDAVEIQQDNPALNYYTKSPLKYPVLAPCKLPGHYLVIENQHPKAVRDRISYGIREYNIPFFGFQDMSDPFCLYIQNERYEVIAGIYGSIWNHYSYIDVLWVEESYRKQGIGTFLMKQTEKFLRSKGSKKVRLDTFDFQAPLFYEKLGFKCFGMIPKCIEGRDRFYLEKSFEI